MKNSEADGATWVKLSVAMSSREDPLSMPEVQQLCRMNADLVVRERLGASLLSAATTDQQLLAHGALRMDIMAGSWLWVLGAYEVFRRAKNRGGPLVEVPQFQALNEQISEIRIVLAKREARGGKVKVHQLPASLYTPDGSFGWGYWDRKTQQQQFFRASFARAWLEAAETLHGVALGAAEARSAAECVS